MTVCTYCLINEATTDDHVIPEGLFDVAPPEGYIYAPACEPCNNGYSRDEEYLLMVLLAEGSISSPAANRVLDRVGRDHRSGRRKRLGLARTLLDNVGEVSVSSPAGVYLGDAQVVALDVTRVNRVLRKITRGLFLHVFGRPLRREAEVSVEISPSAETLGEPDFRSARAEAPFRLGGVFEGSVWTPRADSDESSWVMRFYGTIISLARTRDARAQETGA